MYFSSLKCSTHLCQLDVALTKTNVAGTARQEEGSDSCGLNNDDVDWVKNRENYGDDYDKLSAEII